MTEQEKPQSKIRYDRAEMLMRYAQLHVHPKQQALAIANHYISHAKAAMALKELCECRTDWAGVDGAIQNIASKIIADHRKELGIELDWSRLVQEVAK